LGDAADTSTDRNLAGATLAGRYLLLELLGVGGMGAVYRAHDRELDELVALKVIRADHVARPGMVEQFRHEVKLARRVTHINVARTFELVIADGVMFCTMELVEGESLRDRILRRGAIEIAEAVEIAHAMCQGLAAAHAAGVIHRDIKPDNVLLTPTGRVVIADFGVAAFASDGDGGLSGTLEYMAPEQARGEQASPATDVYAVGAVLFEMLTGLRAFAGTMSELIVAKQDVERLSLDFAEALTAGPLPADLKAVVGEATTADPAHRIPSARELARRLRPWLVEVPEPTDPRQRIAIQMSAVGDIEEEVRVVEALATAVVLAPRVVEGGSKRLHLAEGVHQELLRRLARRPELRVWPRVDAVELPGGTFVELVAGERLTVTIRRDQLASRLDLPLDIASIGLAADAIAVGVVEMAARVPDEDAEARLGVVLEARTLVHAGFSGAQPAYDLLTRAHRRWPDDPRIAAELAVLVLKFAFTPALRNDNEPARDIVQAALVGAPDLAETHVAAGHLALHTGDCATAAREFRIAIACSPYQAEPHEGLGRMLLEAGFFDDAVARLEDALAIAPNLSSVRWEIARAHALEQNWVLFDRLVAELRPLGDRPIARFRCAVWRDSLEEMHDAREAWQESSVFFEPELMQRVFSCVIEGGWLEHRDTIVRVVLGSKSESRRRRAFLAQIGAEVAGHAGDVATSLHMLTVAIEQHDLFDRHWFDRCPLIAAARATPEGQLLQQVVRHRAEAILDALYGDVESVIDTIITR